MLVRGSVYAVWGVEVGEGGEGVWQWRLAGGGWSKHACPIRGNKEPRATHTLATAEEHAVRVQATVPSSMAPHPGWWC